MKLIFLKGTTLWLFYFPERSTKYLKFEMEIYIDKYRWLNTAKYVTIITEETRAKCETTTIQSLTTKATGSKS